MVCNAQLRATGKGIRDPKVVDSFQLRRNEIRDSIIAVRKYHESRKYKDSVARARKAKAVAMKNARPGVGTGANSKNSKELAQFHQTRVDSIKTLQKKRMDSLVKMRKYKTGKRYADSSALSKRIREDSIAISKESFKDSLASRRKYVLDSAKASRKHIMDSIKTVRTKHLDSLKFARKGKSDSLLKAKAEKDKIAKAKEKKRQDEQKLKLEIKFKQKREAWSNTSMLKKKWSPQRRFFQNMFTHYNYYYNANKKMDEAMVNIQRTRRENYDSVIHLYPFDPNKDSASLASDMDSIIRKASIGIQIHDPRVKWANDLYLLLGEANYYRGRFEVASTAFKYIIMRDEEKKKKEAGHSISSSGQAKDEPSIVEEEPKSTFLKHKSVHNESILWLARTYTSWHMTENAQSILSILESDNHVPSNLKGRVAAEKAFAYLTDQNTQAAITQLTVMTEDKYLPDYLRMRAAFLSGQLLQSRGEYTKAIESFEKTLRFFPKLEMDFYARKFIAYNLLLAGEDAATAMKPLKKVLHDAKYVTYYDQVYYVLGKLAIKAGKTDEAVTYLNKSIKTPKASSKQKALSFAALGDAYYTDAKYVKAKLAYDSSSKYATSSGSKDTSANVSVRRSKMLNDIVIPTNIIHDQDSLLALGELSKKEQLLAVRRYIKMLEKAREDSIANAETAVVVAVAAQEPGSNPSDLANWYFTNPQQMQQGSAEFKKKWGTRPLVDNWQRAAAISNASNSGQDELKETEAKDKLAENGLPTEGSLLAKIPKTPEQKEKCEKLEQKAYIQLAKAYFSEFDDYVQATSTLENLDKRFPEHGQKEEELYLQYQIAIKLNQLAKAQTISQQLLAKFPNSGYAKLLKPKEANLSESMVNGVPVAKYYEETYGLLMKHQYSEALTRIEIALKNFDNPVYKRRFLVAEAMAYAGMGNYDKSDTVTTAFLKKYPDPDTLAFWATSIKNYVSSVRKNGVPDWYKESPPGAKNAEVAKKDEKSADTLKKPSDTAIKPPPKPVIPVLYQNKPASEHQCIVVLPGMDSRILRLKKNLKSFDSTNSAYLGLDITIDYFDIDQTVLAVKKFSNMDSAKIYMNAIQTSNVLNEFKSKDYQIMFISSNNYLKLFADKKVDAYVSFYKAVYK